LLAKREERNQTEENKARGRAALKMRKHRSKKQIYVAYNHVIDYINELVAERFSSVSTSESKISAATDLKMLANWEADPVAQSV
jgi:hypothetical protein